MIARLAILALALGAPAAAQSAGVTIWPVVTTEDDRGEDGGRDGGRNFSVSAYLDATREIENWQGRDGRHGERGAYGIREATWRQHMGDSDFALARQERWGRECARRHVTWLQRELQRAGVHPGVFNVALAYNAGLARVLGGRLPERAYDYATRVRNLYRDQIGSVSKKEPVRFQPFLTTPVKTTES